MAIAVLTMNQEAQDHESNNKNNDNNNNKDEHEHDLVMPGFRFHPTEEELVEFYLRRKVEGKRFNVELITFLDLYRYDPWELPALAAIGEKEWFFYVPRDRKYRNGDRPNRVTTSGYWKATGADRMIRSENCRSIGLKKTLVFYSGKAPKGIRTSWIMNEYRLPHHETERLQKAEISLCRVYKRAGVEDHPCIPRSLTTRASASTQSSKKQHEILYQSMDRFQSFGTNNSTQIEEKMGETSGSSVTNAGTDLGLSSHNSYVPLIPVTATATTLVPHASSLVPNCTTIFNDSTSTSMVPPNGVDDFHRLINYHQQVSMIHQQQQIFSTNLQPQILNGSVHGPFSDRLWEWNSMTEASKDYTGPFK
ncbi:hypothetical protein LguiA_008355 [Lonicera macranthoides]